MMDAIEKAAKALAKLSDQEWLRSSTTKSAGERVMWQPSSTPFGNYRNATASFATEGGGMITSLDETGAPICKHPSNARADDHAANEI